MKRFILLMGLLQFLLGNLLAQQQIPLQTFITGGGATGAVYNGTSIPTHFSSIGQPFIMARPLSTDAGGGIMTANELMFTTSTTVATLPTTQPTALSFSNIGTNSLTGSFTAASTNPTGYIVIRKQAAAPVSVPVISVSYNQGDVFGDATVVSIGAATTFNDTGLSPNTTYYYEVFSYNGSGGTINYLTSGPLIGNQLTNFPVPTISSFSPPSGPVGTTVTITGTNFDPGPSNNTVKFNGTTAIVTACTSTSITTSVPTGAITGTITVTVGTQTATSSTNFTIIPAPTIANFNPTSGAVGTAVTLTGTNFDATKANNSVSFNGTSATVTSSTTTTIITSVPAGATTGPIAVTVAGLTGTSSGDFIVISDNTPPQITGNSTQPFVAPNSSALVSVTVVDNQSPVQNVTISYGPANSTTLIEHDVTMSNSSGNTWQYTIPATAFTELGVSYSIQAFSAGGNTGYMPYSVGIIYSGTGLNIPYTSNGSDVSNYRIISIPLTVTGNTVNDIFHDELGNYGDKTKWRMYRYFNGATKELSGDTIMGPGKGYWFIAASQVTINTGAGTTVQASSGAPFHVSLKAGWNEIGNPYNYNLSWTDVQTANTGLPGLRIYDGNPDYKDATQLNAKEGGFVKVAAAQTLVFPVLKNASVNGRHAIETTAQNRNGLDNTNWQVNLKLQQGDLTNWISGFGMNEKASLGFDAYDGFNMPKFFDKYLVLNHNKKDGDDYYSNDVVPTTNNYVWDFFVESTSSERLITINWDNSYFGQNDKELYLWDVNLQRVFNMRSSNSYQFDKNNSQSFKIVYGSSDFVKDKVGVQEMIIHNVWPNPTSGDATLSFTLPESTTDQKIEFSLTDTMGKNIWVNQNNYSSGYHEVILKRSEQSAGVYIIRLVNGSTVKLARLVIK